MENHNKTSHIHEKDTSKEKMSDNAMHNTKMHSNSHNMDHSMHMGDFKKRFFISLIISIPIILLSPMMGMSLPFQLSFNGSDWIVFILATILFFYGGKPFLTSAIMEIKMGNPAMMTLISLGITVSYIYSAYGFLVNKFFTTQFHFMNFFWELATLIVIMLLGHWIEMNAISKAGNALEKMASLLPSMVHLVNKDGSIKNIPLKELKQKDNVLVRAGENIPGDGVIILGTTTVNESLITGEVKDVSKTINDKVIGGSINGNGEITLTITTTGKSGYLSQVLELISKAQKDKSKIETISDKVAKALFYIALVTGILSFLVWYFMTKDINIALSRMVTVFIIACPHALGLAIPLVIARSATLGASHGLLLQNKKAIQQAKNISIALIDKTGTLTKGDFSLRLIKSFSKNFDENQILTLFASLEYHSNHPLAVGIIKAAKEKNISLIETKDIQNLNGIGLFGKINNEEFFIVSLAYLDKNNISYEKEDFQEALNKGYSVSFLLKNKILLGMVALGDEIKPTAKKTISVLKSWKITPVMLTGDNYEAAKTVAKELDISDFKAQLLPSDKEKIVRTYQKKNKKVIMVGDGINDAPSLVRANIGIAIGAGTDIAIDSADVVLVKSNPLDILVFLTLAKRTTKKMVQNLWWGAGYNILAIPAAAGVLAPIGIILSPSVGAILMSLSTIIVAVNAMTLNLKNIE